MARKKRGRLRFLKRKKFWLLTAVVLLILLATGYSYRDSISAAIFNSHLLTGLAVPQVGAHPEEPAGQDKAPGPDKPILPEPPEDPGEVSPPPPPPDQPAGELLHIADGSYLLALVSRRTTLGNYTPGDLVQIDPELINPAQRQWSYFLRHEAYRALRRMWEAARAEGVVLLVTSAYRSYQTQDTLFRDYASRHGEQRANRFSARAGQSEHQLGTAVDFGGTTADHTSAFAETQAGRWLAARAHEFGFALSYPDGTYETTGYIFEPWHFRYIGMEAAQEWKKSGSALSQFLENKPQHWRD